MTRMSRPPKQPPTEQYSEAETIKRRDDAMRRALNTPPKPYKDSKARQTKPVRKPSTGKK